MTGAASALVSIIFLAQVMGTATVPDTDEQKAVIKRMRDAALTYSDRLQDFLCIEFMTRAVDHSGAGKQWKILETQELELGYISHQEHYRLLKVNGKTTGLESRVKRGYWIPKGEFGSSLLYIFEPKVLAEFYWDHEETSAGRRSCVFRYEVPVATTTYEIQADFDHVRMAHHGHVTADCETGAVTRIQIETDPASIKRRGRDLAIGMQLDLRYRPIRIGSSEFLLPERAVEMAAFGRTLTRVEIQFDSYRKYDSNSNITFDDGTVKAK